MCFVSVRSFGSPGKVVLFVKFINFFLLKYESSARTSPIHAVCSANGGGVSICIQHLHFFIQLIVILQIRSPPHNLDSRTTITIDDRTFVVEADDLEKICDLGRGAYGIVEKMRHRQTGTVMAVKRITATVNTQEQVRCADHALTA